MEKLPTFSVDLVNKLNELYPLRNPVVTNTEKEIMYKAGQRAVVEFLLSRMPSTDDNLLNNNYGE